MTRCSLPPKDVSRVKTTADDLERIVPHYHAGHSKIIFQILQDCTNEAITLIKFVKKEI